MHQSRRRWWRSAPPVRTAVRYAAWTDTGIYQVTFDCKVGQCAWVATPTEPGFVSNVDVPPRIRSSYGTWTANRTMLVGRPWGEMRAVSCHGPDMFSGTASTR